MKGISSTFTPYSFFHFYSKKKPQSKKIESPSMLLGETEAINVQRAKIESLVIAIAKPSKLLGDFITNGKIKKLQKKISFKKKILQEDWLHLQILKNTWLTTYWVWNTK